MAKKITTKRIISIIISVVMLLTAFPLVAVADGETPAVKSEGEWDFGTSKLNSTRTSFNDVSTTDNVWIAVADTDFYFMQTTDNQVMTYTTHLYAKKKQRLFADAVWMADVAINQFDDDYVQAVGDNAQGWSNSNPFPTELLGSGSGGVFTDFEFTASFTADGNAEYHPQWIVTYANGNPASSTIKTALSNVTSGTNPTFTIVVVDMRELLNAIDVAESRGKDTSAVLSGFDTTGATYYTQEQVDEKLDEVMQLMCADYTALKAAIANAEALGENEKIPGGTKYEKSSYNAMASALAQAKAIDRYLEDTAENNAFLNAKAAELQAKVDAVVLTDTEVISYYVDGVLYATSEFVPNQGYNFHDVTDHFVADPTKANATFGGWRDADGNKIAPNTPVNSSFSVYAYFIVDTRGAGPVEQFGRYDHNADANYDDGRGANGVTLWVENNNFNFVQTKDNQEFSFNAAVSAVKNDPARFARVTQVVFRDSNTAFITENNLSNDDIVYYCETGNAGVMPADNSDGNLPGVSGATFEEQMQNSVVRWRYIYTFPANGVKTYTFDWTIKFKSGSSSSSTSTYTEYVTFNINVTDLREIIRVYAKARSVANSSTSPLSPEDQAALINLVEYIGDNYDFDGTAYYPQDEINGLVNQLNAYLGSGTFPCDYTALDAAIAQAADIIAIGNDNNRYMSEEWQDLLDAYSAATTVDRNLIIDNNNVNQPMIDQLTEDLLYAIEALSYKTHQHAVVDTSDLEELVDESINNEPGTNNDDGKYDDDAWNEYIDALNDAQDVIDNYPDPTYDNDNGDGQKEVDDAEQRLQDALDALNDPANQNAPCDYTALDDAIAAAESISDSDLFTPATYQALQDALADGQNVERDLYDNGTNQQIIDDATQAILDAIANLLADAIDKAEDIDTTGITPASAQNLEDAIDNGQAVADDNTSTADEMASAINDIVSALDGLEPDKSELEEKIEEGNNKDTTGYTDESIQALEDAIAAGETVYNDPDATVEEIQDAIQAIDDALNGLKPDKTELEEAINAGEGIDTTDIPQNLVDALEDALDNGETVDSDDDATLQEVTDATQDIIDAIKDILEYVKDEADNTDTTGLTPETVQDLEDAIDNAETVLNNPDATAEEIADAIEQLQDALDGLKPDKTELEEAINAGEGIDTTDIPQNLVDALEDALDNGDTVDNDDDATVQEVKDATDDIIDAIKDILEYVKDEADNTDTTGLTPETVQDLEDAIDNAETVLNNPDATAEEIADAIDQLQDALDGLTPDKTELEEAIDAGESIDTTDIPQNLVDALEDALDNGDTVDNDDDATVPEIKDATDDIIDAIKDILEYVKDEAEDTNTSDLTDDSLQDLEDAIENAENILNDPDADPDDIADAIEQLQDVIGNLEMNKIVPDAAGDINVDRADTNYYYLVGLEADDTTLANVKSLLENDGRQIIAFRGETQLGENDHIGTGCVIKCVSIKDPSIVYEQATVILYGDVNGDGLVNNTDYDAMFNETLLGVAIEGELFRIAGDLNNDEVIDGFDLSKLDLQLTGAREFDQTVEYYK